MSTSSTADGAENASMSSTTLSQLMQRRLSVEELPDIFSDYNNLLLDDDNAADDTYDDVVAAIDYTSDFRTVYKYMKIVLAKNNEFSIRTFQLSSLCLQYNPANYTIWYYRRQCMKQILIKENDNDVDDNDNKGQRRELLLSLMIDADMQFATNLGGENPKNYQLWYHRRALLEMLLLQTQTQKARDQEEPNNNDNSILTNKCQQEMNYIDNVLVNDGKNYHAWSYRQWIILQLLLLLEQQQASSASSSELLLDGELHMTDRLLNVDVRNNSVWNHRWFIFIQKQKQQTSTINVYVDDEEQEMEYALSMMKLDLYNESPIQYYSAYVKRKIFALQKDDAQQQVKDDILSRALEQLNSLMVQDQDDDLGDDDDNNQQPQQQQISPCVLSAIVDILEWKGDAASLQQAIMYTDKLAHQYDCIRERYWIYRKQQLQDRLD